MRSSLARRLFRIRRSERGGALVELAVVLPVIVLIAIGVMDYGRVYYTSVTVVNAARAGAEWGAYGRNGSVTDNTEIQNFAKLEGAEAGTINVTSHMVCRCTPGGATVSCTTTCSGGYGAPQVYVTAIATKTVTLLLKYPGLPSTVTISDSATFRAN
jgi:Flp pilus assembly protein TadG